MMCENWFWFSISNQVRLLKSIAPFVSPQRADQGNWIAETATLIGELTCPPCAGFGKLRNCLNLKISWNTESPDKIFTGTSLPKDLSRTAPGRVALKKISPSAQPRSNDPDIIRASTRLIMKQNSRQRPGRKIIAQRQQIRLVPISQV